MNLEKGLLRETVDGKSAVVVFDKGLCLVAMNINEPEWVVCALPEKMSDEIRAREGDLRIEEFGDDAEFAILVTIDTATLAFCSTLGAQRFLVRKPEMLFTA